MLRNRALQRGAVIAALIFCGVAAAQDTTDHSYTEQELEKAGLTQEQIEKLRVSVQEPASEALPEALIGYSSVFENYTPYDYVPDIGWREANDRVGEIGGWRAYLKMVQDASKPEAVGEDESDSQ